MLHKKKFSRVDVFTGLGQSQSIHELIERQKIQSIEETLVAPKITGSLVRDVSNLELVEKHALLDVMTFGSLSQKGDSLEERFGRLHASYGRH